MKVLLTGSFGNIGRSTLDELLAQGYTVRCFDVPTPANRRIARAYAGRAEIIWGDIRRYEDVLAAVTGVDAVLHVAFVIPKLSVTGTNSETRPEWAREINVGGTRNIVRAVAAQPISPLLIFTSSLHVYGRTQHLPAPRTASDPVDPIEHYAKHKVECEQMIRESGLQWAIFRLGASMPVRLIFDHGMFEVRPQDRIEYVHTRDVGLALVNGLTHDVWGKTLLIGGGPRCQYHYREVVNGVMDAIGIGSLPDEAFTQVPYPVDWLDTTESQRILKFQRFTFDDYIREVVSALGARRRLIQWFRPLVRRWVLGFSEFYREAQRAIRPPKLDQLGSK